MVFVVTYTQWGAPYRLAIGGLFASHEGAVAWVRSQRLAYHDLPAYPQRIAVTVQLGSGADDHALIAQDERWLIEEGRVPLDPVLAVTIEGYLVRR